MLRVFGITYDHTVNYGSCFQAYALQNAVEGTILTDGAGCKYQLIPVRNCEDWPVQMSWKRILVLPFVKLHHQRFAEFESKNINFVPIRRIQDFPILNKDSDVFVCGSDVIWNPDENKNIEAFYLNFAEKYKFSYAASFGKAEVSETTKDFIRRNLITFNSLSVRESSGVDIINSCIDYPSPIRLVCDPVVLLKSVDWEKLIISNDPKVNNKYIFVYITHLSTSVQTFIKRLGQETGYKIVYAAYGPKQALKQGMLQVQTPEKWLQLLHDAEYVVTNSFHATVFSVLFHKKFFTVVNGDKEKGINVRMNDFLTAIGLPDRILSDIPSELDLSEIDYTEVDKKIDAMRRESLDFLRQNLEAAYQRKKEQEAVSQ